ncbi:hypothetical protein [Clostridium baratii]
MNYSREEFFQSTFKEIVDLIEEGNKLNEQFKEEDELENIDLSNIRGFEL